MAFQTYEELNQAAMRFYGEQNFAKTLELLTAEGASFPEQAPTIYYLRSCMAARIGQPELALQILQEALDQGIWYGETLIRESPSWQPLQGLPAFEEMAKICKDRQLEAETGPEVFVQEPENSHPLVYPLFLALHGNGDNGKASLNGWLPVTKQGWRLAAIQSSQLMMTGGGYIWNDQALALREIEEQYKALHSRYTVNPEKIIVAGFSMGGETALRLALTGPIPVKGFILLGPGGPTIDEPELWLPLIEEYRQKPSTGLRGYIFIGEQDTDIEPQAVVALAELLNSHGIPCKLEKLPGLRHEYPPDFEPGLSRALGFIEQSA
jgi:predicted esterase